MGNGNVADDIEREARLLEQTVMDDLAVKLWAWSKVVRALEGIESAAGGVLRASAGDGHTSATAATVVALGVLEEAIGRGVS